MKQVGAQAKSTSETYPAGDVALIGRGRRATFPNHYEPPLSARPKPSLLRFIVHVLFERDNRTDFLLLLGTGNVAIGTRGRRGATS